MIENVPQLHMRRDLDALPDLVVPPGYLLRAMDPGDLASWAALLHENRELGDWTVERAQPFFAADSPMPLEGSFLITWDSAPVATAQLHLQREPPYAPIPELGWVAVSPAHQGHALGAVVVLAVMHYAASAGHHEIFLRTDDQRLAAIRTYLKLGFEPWMYDPTAPERWRVVLERLNRPRR